MQGNKRKTTLIHGNIRCLTNLVLEQIGFFGICILNSVNADEEKQILISMTSTSGLSVAELSVIFNSAQIIFYPVTILKHKYWQYL